jgi:hypothetical protein
MRKLLKLVHAVATIGMTVPFISIEAFAQSRRAPELRSCLTSEMSLVAVENVDRTKSFEENKEIGRKFGYVIGEFYKKAIWALDDPDTEGREVVMYALEKFQTRMKYMNHAQLAKEVKDCRASFGN